MLLPLIPERNHGSNYRRLNTYQLYGLTLASDFPFANNLIEGKGRPDLTFHMADEPLVTGWEQDPPIFPRASQLRDEEDSTIYVYRAEGCYVVHLPRVADYYLYPKSIVCHLLDAKHNYLIEIHLLGVVLSLWLELQGKPALHASAVVVEHRAAVFLATNSGGKSSLAASLMQAGYPLLTDDILPLERRKGVFLGSSGYPQMRMWPDQAQHFLNHYRDLGIVHPAYSKRRVPVGKGGLGSFYNGLAPLACFYLPERRDPNGWGTKTNIIPVPRTESLIALVRHSFVALTVEALRLQPQRLKFFAPLVAQVPVRRIIYPEGYEHLSAVRQSILNDLAGHNSLAEV
jgi:hypothetical protein